MYEKLPTTCPGLSPSSPNQLSNKKSQESRLGLFFNRCAEKIEVKTTTHVSDKINILIFIVLIYFNKHFTANAVFKYL